MVNYQQGKIYRLVCNTTGLVYVGSTCEPTLTRRLQTHKGDYKKFLDGKNKNLTSFQILKNNYYEIILIEVYPCNSKDELHQRERHYIETMECVNIQIPGRTCKEYYIENKETICEKHREHYNQTVEQQRERSRKYREENHDKCLETQKEYKLNNKDKIKEQSKNYREENKEKLKEKSIKYREDNKEKIRERKRKWRESKKIKNQTTSSTVVAL
jgi:hypothetical protein